MNYKILNSGTTKNFEELVESYLKDGWELQGGVSKFKPYLIFYQAVTKRSDKKEF